MNHKINLEINEMSLCALWIAAYLCTTLAVFIIEKKNTQKNQIVDSQ